MRAWPIVFTAAILSLIAVAACAQELWVSKDGNVRNIDMRAMFFAGGEMYFATRNEVYRSVGPKQKLESVFSLPSSENEIQCRGPRHGDAGGDAAGGIQVSGQRQGMEPGL